MNIMLGGTVTTLPESLRGPFEDFAQKANGADAESWGSEFKKFLRKEPCWVSTAGVPRAFTTWKTITLGTHRSAKDLKKDFTDGGFRIGGRAAQILKKISLAGTEMEIELVLVTVANLGFTEETRLDAIYDRGKELGLDLVPAEVGPQLRLQYTDQPMDEWMVMAMEPIADSDGDLLVFGVGRREDGLWLYAHCGHPDDVWRPGNRWVFARRKQN